MLNISKKWISNLNQIKFEHIAVINVENIQNQHCKIFNGIINDWELNKNKDVKNISKGTKLSYLHSRLRN